MAFCKHSTTWYKDTLHQKIATNLCTERNLMIIIDIFDLACKENYDSKIMDKLDELSDYWYQILREEEKKERTAKKRNSN